MLKKNIKTDEPITVTVGDVRFSILRIGERKVAIGVDAPRDVPVDFGVRIALQRDDGGQSYEPDPEPSGGEL